MKTLRMLGMALVAILMSVNFAACSSDDDEELPGGEEGSKDKYGVITGQRKLMRMVVEFNDDYTTESFFYYDSNEHLAKMDVDLSGNCHYSDFKWENYKIELKSSKQETPYTVYLQGGLATKGFAYDDGYSFTYDSSNRLSKLEYGRWSHNRYEDYYVDITWNGNKVENIVFGGDEKDRTCTIEYSSQTCKGYFPLFAYYVIDNCFADIDLAHPELFGVRSNALPSKIFSQGDGWTASESFAYTFDDKGYVKTCNITANEGSGDYPINYTFFWE